MVLLSRRASPRIGLLESDYLNRTPWRARTMLGCGMHLYGQYCPVARAAEILADRWTVLIVRVLLADMNQFNALERGLPHISRTLLAVRLRRPQQTGVVGRRATARGKPVE